ncbi:MAG: TIGR00341 family protein [Thiotrichales bacterium]|nr:TIGR00341 family protein [Thiotrichales bacterium]
MAESGFKYTLVFDADKQTEFEETVLPSLADWDVEQQSFQSLFTEGSSPSFDEDSRLLAWLSDAQLSQFLAAASKGGWQVGVLPHPEVIRFYRSFPIKTKLPDALADIQSTETPNLADLMTCNGELVFGSVMLGKQETMAPAAQVDLGFFSKIVNLIRLTFRLSQTRLSPIQIQTAKQTKIHTAALGMAVVYRENDSEFTKSIVGEVVEDEASLNTVILAPRSISEVLRFLLGRVFPKKPQKGQLPGYLGVIKTSAVTFSSHQPIDYNLNGETFSADSLTLEVQADALRLMTQKLPPKSHAAPEELKESMRITGLPKGQAVDELVKYPLPWIHHADQDEVKETFVTLKENARINESFLVLMVLSTLLATVGLFANSAPVIIGAMILAPLMSPIISLSMGVLRQESDLSIPAGKTLLVGILLALGFGTLLTCLMPLHAMNYQISSRLSPTLLDLGVAVISGIAGAYASARSEVARSFAGVAIAVALVPPLAVSGIGIGWMDFNVFQGAFLLFITNLIGIVLAAAVTFLLMGFSPFHLAKKGMSYSLLLVVLIAIPLGFSFHTMVDEQRMVTVLEGQQIDGIEIRQVKVRHAGGGKPDLISATLVSRETLDSNKIDQVKQQMEKQLGHAIILEATLAVRR